MKVIGTKGVSQLIPTNTLVSTQDGMAGYTAKDNSVSVIVTTDCTVTFESNGGTEVPSQTVQYGEKVKKPEDPIREGYHLEGWYRDLDRTQKWDFHKDTVKGNMTLYANWADEPIPMLGNVTPRQAMQTPAGLERVKGLIRSYESSEKEQAALHHRAPVSYVFLWESIGLSALQTEAHAARHL